MTEEKTIHEAKGCLFAIEEAINEALGNFEDTFDVRLAYTAFVDRDADGKPRIRLNVQLID